jgi:hypothetical protein
MLDYPHIEAREAVIQSALALSDLEASHIAIYLTVLFAYIAVAYVVGKKLTRLQLAITTLLFIAASAYEVFTIVAVGAAAKIKRDQIIEFGGRASETLGGPPDLMLIILWSSGAVAALVFMWSVRYSKVE